MLHWLYTYITSVCFKYFSYFKRMLQVFYMDIAYVAVAIHVSCKCMSKCVTYFNCFIWILYMLQYCICFTHLLQESIQNISSISDLCCKCVYMDVIVAIHMLQMYVCKCFTCFRRMLQKCFHVATLAGVATWITKHDYFNNSLSIYKYNYLLKYIKTENNAFGCF